MDEEVKKTAIDGLNAFIDKRMPWCKEQDYTGTNVHKLIRMIERGTGAWPTQSFDRYLYLFLMNKRSVMTDYIKEIGGHLKPFAGYRAHIWETLERDLTYQSWRDPNGTEMPFLQEDIDWYKSVLEGYDKEEDLKAVEK